MVRAMVGQLICAYFWINTPPNKLYFTRILKLAIKFYKPFCHYHNGLWSVPPVSLGGSISIRTPYIG